MVCVLFMLSTLVGIVFVVGTATSFCVGRTPESLLQCHTNDYYIINWIWGVMSPLADFACAFMAMVAVSRTKVRMYDKMCSGLLIVVGLFGAVCSCIRLAIVTGAVGSAGVGSVIYAVRIGILSMIEAGITIVVACIPILRPMLQHLWHKSAKRVHVGTEIRGTERRADARPALLSSSTLTGEACLTEVECDCRPHASFHAATDTAPNSQGHLRVVEVPMPGGGLTVFAADAKSGFDISGAMNNDWLAP